MKRLLASILRAMQRCRYYAVSIFILYCIACTTGIIMSHLGNEIALSQRDKIVGNAVKSDASSLDYQSGNNYSAALHDCAGNIIYAAVPQTVLGLGIIVPYFTVAYQGWVGGIVSVDGSHKSRFRNVKSAAYYIIVLLMQFLPFSLTIGAGIRCGVDLYKYNRTGSWKLWKYRFPLASLRDLGLVYLVSVPLFFIASCFEFLSTWNI
jgi:hypothetical protein